MKKIKWGVMGTAFIFERDTAEGMRQAENCEMYAIAGRSLEKAEQFKEKYGFEKAYGSYQELLDDPEVEAVYIPLPNTMHMEWTIRALQAKKHVLCEKPIAPTREDAEKMFAAAKENGVFLMEAFAYLHSPLVAAVRDEVKNGVIGDICYMEAALITSFYDLSNIRMRRETAGGSVYDLGVYCNSLIQTMFGEEPETVTGTAKFSDDKIDLYTAALLQFKNGGIARIGCGMVLAPEPFTSFSNFRIHGTKGSIVSGSFEFNLPGELTYILETFDGKKEEKQVHVPHNYRLEVEQLGRCILDGETPAVSEEFSLTNARTIDRILEAIGY